MNKKELIQLFQDNSEEFCEFENINPKKFGTKRSDLYGFLLLDSLVFGEIEIVSWAGHDEICLSVSLNDLAKAATKEDVVDLMRCGIRYSSEYDCLAMFV